jgi:acyl-CoA thioester hydrolase
MDFPKHISRDKHRITVVPRYCETDQGGVVHHSVYPVWFEMGRTELLRVNKVAYKDLESAGVFFVVAELRVKYRAAAFYDEALELETGCTSVTAAKIIHSYRLYNKKTRVLLSEGETVLACVDEKGNIRRIPEFMYLCDEKVV